MGITSFTKVSFFLTLQVRVLSGGGGETRVCFPPKIIWQNNGNYTGIALFLITLQASTILFKSESESSSGPSIAMPGVGVGVSKG